MQMMGLAFNAPFLQDLAHAQDHVKGARPFEGFKKVVDEELARAKGEKVPEAAGDDARGAAPPKMGLLAEKKARLDLKGAIVRGGKKAKKGGWFHGVGGGRAVDDDAGPRRDQGGRSLGLAPGLRLLVPEWASLSRSCQRDDCGGSCHEGKWLSPGPAGIPPDGKGESYPLR